jgi:hypothetical protein
VWVKGELPLVLYGRVYGVKRALLNALVLHLNLGDKERGGRRMRSKKR